MSDARAQVTRLLALVDGKPVDGQSADGQPASTDPAAAREQLLMLVYDELRALAQRRMNAERVGHTLQATALVHEAWMRLAGTERMGFGSRRHFFGAAAEAMRRVLVDHARKVKTAKRGGEADRISLSLADVEVDEQPERLLALNEALDSLEAEDPRAAEVARLRWFAGLEVKQVAEAMEVSERTVMREWAFAKARLSELLGDDDAGGAAPDPSRRGGDVDPRGAPGPSGPGPTGAS
jgi:RNA polymerase sigma factor (TIGR02999 family)